MKSVVVIGNGWLGRRIINHLRAVSDAGGLPGWSVPDIYHQQDYGPGYAIDVLDPYTILTRLAELRAALVINASGKTGRPNIDWCKHHPVVTFAVNVCGSYNVARACLDLDIPMIQLGSGCIYRQHTDPGAMCREWREGAVPNFAGSTYSASAIAREAVLSTLRDVCILRLRLPFDTYAHPRNAITKLSKYEAVVDSSESATYVPDLLKVIEHFILCFKQGVWNCVNPGVFNPYEVACLTAMSERRKCPVKWTIDQLDAACIEQRSHCLLDNAKLQRAVGFKLTSVNNAVAEAIQAGAHRFEVTP